VSEADGDGDGVTPVGSAAAPSSSVPAKGTRRRLDHIDAMRPVKQAAVISTHTLVFFAPLATSSTVVGLIMLTRFSRDAFLFVSACMLAYSYRDTATIKLSTYFKRRFVSVGVPYLVWTVIYYFYTSLHTVSSAPYYAFTGTGVFSIVGLHHFIHLLLTGYYHLYFLILIMEFYVVFPVLLIFVRRFSNKHVTIFVVAALWQLAFGVMVSGHFFGFRLSGFLQTRLATSYSIYLIGGIVVALHLEEIHRWIVQHGRSIVAGTLVSAFVAEYVSYLGRFHWLPNYVRTGPYVFSALLVPYNVGAILCIYLLGVYLVSSKRTWRTRAAVKSGSDNSYGVYLSQMIWIPLLVRLRADLGFPVAWWVAAPIALAIVYGLGFVFSALVARTPFAKSVAGRSRASWASLLPRRSASEEFDSIDGGGPLDVVRD
jgi:peptidoglycan/LPS O-acetylase OafA/YrhL